MLAPQPASAQLRRLPRPPSIIYSTLLYTEAQALIAVGRARIVNAKAASMEMDNAVKWVNTYFKRKQLNQKWRNTLRPPYIEREEKRQKMYRRLIDNNLAALTGDLSEELNWMLREILAHTSYEEFMSDTPNSMISSPHNARLEPRDLHQIQMTEGKLAGGKAIKIRADTADVLETNWPMALRDKQFKAARKAFEDARDWAVAELKNDKTLSDGGTDRLMAAVDRLTAELTAAYPRERLKSLPPREGLAYLAAKRFLQSLAGSTFRLIETNSALAFDDSYRFQGTSVAELLQHLMSRGLEFAPAEPGGEATYRKLYNSVRGFYLQIVPDPNT